MAAPLRAGIVAAFALAVLPACRTPDAAPASLESYGGERADPDYQPKSLTIPVDPKAIVADALKPYAPAAGLRLADNGAPLDARFFMVIYGYQMTGPFNLPRFTHSWGLFISANGALENADFQTFTISWDAADGDIGLLQPVEPGHNYSLADSFDLAAGPGATIRRSRVVEISPTLFSRAVAQLQKLEGGEQTGAIRYKMTDDRQGRLGALRGNGYLNCQHALTDIVAGMPGRPFGSDLVETGLLRGWAASDNAFALLSASPFGVRGFRDLEGAVARPLGL